MLTSDLRLKIIFWFCLVNLQITFELTVKQLMSFDPGEWSESLRKEYVLVIEGFFTLPLPLLSSTYRRAIKVHTCNFNFFWFLSIIDIPHTSRSTKILVNLSTFNYFSLNWTPLN